MIGTVGVSVWQGGTVALAVPVENRGGRGAGNVTVTALTLGTGARTDPTSLPVALGEIAPNGRGVVQASFTSLAVPNSYLLTVQGIVPRSRPYQDIQEDREGALEGEC